MHDRSTREGPARPPRRRPPRVAALAAGVVLALGLAACAGGSKNGGVASLSGSGQHTSATTAGNNSRDQRQAFLDYAKCMRQHGIDMPDPQFTDGGGVNMTIRGRGPGAGGKGPEDDPKLKAAQQACQHFLPNGGEFKRPNAQQVQQMVNFARCMRQHGIDVPDPGANGGITVRGGSGPNGKVGANPDDPKFKAAQQACQHFLPNAGKPKTSTGGGR
jgi:hypothetical protein